MCQGLVGQLAAAVGMVVTRDRFELAERWVSLKSPDRRDKGYITAGKSLVFQRGDEMF